MTGRPSPVPVPWEALHNCRRTGNIPLPNHERAWLIRRVIIPGVYYRIAGPEPDDDRFVEVENGPEIPATVHGEPTGTFAVVFNARGRETGRVIELKGIGIPPRSRNGEDGQP